MENVTVASDPVDAVSAGDVVAFIVIPIFFGILVYATLSMFVWPYARPLLPLWLIVFAILLPPFFPFLLFYVLFVVLLFTPVEPVYVVEVEPVSDRRVDRRVRDRPTTTRAIIVERSSPRGNRV